MMDPACEVSEKGTRETNDGSEALEEAFYNIFLFFCNANQEKQIAIIRTDL